MARPIELARRTIELAAAVAGSELAARRPRRRPRRQPTEVRQRFGSGQMADTVGMVDMVDMSQLVERPRPSVVALAPHVVG